MVVQDPSCHTVRLTSDAHCRQSVFCVPRSPCWLYSSLHFVSLTLFCGVPTKVCVPTWHFHRWSREHQIHTTGKGKEWEQQNLLFCVGVHVLRPALGFLAAPVTELPSPHRLSEKCLAMQRSCYATQEMSNTSEISWKLFITHVH